MSRISKIAKKIVGWEIRDIKYALEEYGGSAGVASEAMRNAVEALERDDINGAWNALSRLSPRAKQMVPSQALEWLDQQSGKERPRESWKVQVARDIKQVFGRGQEVDWVYSSFLTYSEGTSNKFHYFAVVFDGSEYVGGNAYGKIGQKAKVIEIARSASKGLVMGVVQNKEYEKKRKGYQIA